jgi:hypothetical protein
MCWCGREHGQVYAQKSHLLGSDTVFGAGKMCLVGVKQNIVLGVRSLDGMLA